MPFLTISTIDTITRKNNINVIGIIWDNGRVFYFPFLRLCVSSKNDPKPQERFPVPSFRCVVVGNNIIVKHFG